MCGIAGIITREQSVADQAVERMNAAQQHRGPDGSGKKLLSFGTHWLGLGHRRLSILDLSPAGSQPMARVAHPDSWLTFNGEIYNFADLKKDLTQLGHSFRSTGDSEVLAAALQEWGTSAVRKLNGMFAFAYFDATRRRLLLARDSAGMKPLYMFEGTKHLLFASEVRALLATDLVPRRISRTGLAGYLAYGAVQHPFTLFEGVVSLPPGSYQEFAMDDGQGYRAISEPVPYWTYPTPKNRVDHLPANGSADKIVASANPQSLVREVIDESVKRHLISDVPVGVFLSSGIDSTVVAGLAGKYAPKIQTFTVSFADNKDLDESTVAAQTAQRFGLPHRIVSILTSDAEASTAEWLERIDQPSMDGLNVYVISKAVRNKDIKVALSGQGGDELFGGYPSFIDVPKLQRLSRWIRPLPKSARRSLAALATLRKSAAVRGKAIDMLGGPQDIASLTLHRRRLLSTAQMASLGLHAEALGLDPCFQLSTAIPSLADVVNDPFAAISRMESVIYQGNVLLRDGDANGMAHGLEIRLPLLDQPVLNAIHALPGSIRMPAGARPKQLLCEAFPELLTPEIIHQRKMGFVFPIRRWMLTSMRAQFQHGANALKQLNVLDANGIDQILNEFWAEPESPSWTRAFSLSVLGNYLVRHGAQAS